MEKHAPDCAITQTTAASVEDVCDCGAEQGAPTDFDRFGRRPDNNPKSVLGIKKPPLHLCPPVAKIEWATAMLDGANKYGAYNWREHGVSASVYKAAAERHLDSFWDGENQDPDSLAHHLGSVMACCSILLDAMSCGNLIDDRPRSGMAADMHRAWCRRFDREELDVDLDIGDAVSFGGRMAHVRAFGDTGRRDDVVWVAFQDDQSVRCVNRKRLSLIEKLNV